MKGEGIVSVCTYVCREGWVYVCVCLLHICIWRGVCICGYIWVCVCVHGERRVSVYVCVFMCVHVCVRVCVSVCVCIGIGWRVFDPVGLELQVVVSYRVVAGN